MKKLLVYTGRQKIAPDFIREADLFLYPFTHVISRTQHKLDFFNFELQSESVLGLTSRPSNGMSFEECANSRALDLLNLKKTNYYLLWSGGIDSTVALVAILKNWPKSEAEKLTVVLTTHSIRENPTFFASTISKLKILNYFDAIPALFHGPESLIITGELGDQIFGSGMLMPIVKKMGGDAFSQSLEKYGSAAIDEYLRVDSRRGEGLGASFMKKLTPIADECPFRISNLFEFFWWFNFTQEWQFAKFKFLENLEVPASTEYGVQILHFFDSIDFQTWSLNSAAERRPADWADYKSIAKKFIYAFTKQESDLSLLKRQSLKNTYYLQSFRVAVSDDHREILSYTELADYVRS